MKTIQLTDEQYKVLQEVLLEQGFKLCEETKAEIEKWQPKSGEWFVAGEGSVIRHSSQVGFTNFGTEYPTKEAAEKARDTMRVHNRLLAWLAENDDGWVADWDDDSQAKWFVFYNPRDGRCRSGANSFTKGLGAVYMSQQNAEKLCNLLNEGGIDL
jgi:hypothetical protein